MRKRAILLIWIMTIALITVNSSSSQMEGLIGAWLFDEDSGGEAKDASGNGHDGELVGNATWEKNGRFGSALSCDGSEAYVMVPDHEDFEFAGDFTIACWFQNDTPPSDHSGLVTKGYDKPSGAGGDAKPWYLVYFLTSGTVDLYLRDASSVNSRALGTTPVNDGEWHHVVAMKDGDKVKVYVDGKEDAAADAVDATYGENDQPLVFMVHFQRWIKGLMDEVAIFNRALSEDEINLIMNGGLNQVVLAVEPAGKLAAAWGTLKISR
jgi:hypothetical protein